jgi:Mce-associated membrane protein
MTMLGRRKRDKAAKEAATDAKTTATEAESEAVDTEAVDAEAVDTEAADTESEAVADEDLADEDLTDEEPVDEDLTEEDLADEDLADEAAEGPVKKIRSRPARVVKVARTEPAEVDEEQVGSPRGAVLVVAVLSVVTIALAATVVLLWSWKNDLNAKESAAQDGLNAATSAAQDFSSYDYRTLDSNIKTTADTTTGTFRQQYLSTMNQVRQTAQQQQTVVVGTVLKAGIEQLGAGQMVAVIFLNQETSKLNQARGTDQYRLRLTVDKVKGRWLVSKLEAL